MDFFRKLYKILKKPPKNQDVKDCNQHNSTLNLKAAEINEFSDNGVKDLSVNYGPYFTNRVDTSLEDKMSSLDNDDNLDLDNDNNIDYLDEFQNILNMSRSELSFAKDLTLDEINDIIDTEMARSGVTGGKDLDSVEFVSTDENSKPSTEFKKQLFESTHIDTAVNLESRNEFIGNRKEQNGITVYVNSRNNEVTSDLSINTNPNTTVLHNIQVTRTDETRLAEENDVLSNMENIDAVNNIIETITDLPVSVINALNSDIETVKNGISEDIDDIIGINKTDLDDMPLSHFKKIKLEQNEITSSDKNSELQDLKLDEIEVISISSEDSTCTGYASSDFEFIGEDEARQDGFIINFNRKKYLDAAVDPGEGTSRSAAVHRSDNYLDRSYRNNHVVPQDDGYYSLFQGIYDPMLQYIHFNENKSIHVSAMHAQYEGLGFDRQLIGRRYIPDDCDREFEDEAKETVGRIMSMYPRENRMKRRSRRLH